MRGFSKEISINFREKSDGLLLLKHQAFGENKEIPGRFFAVRNS